MKIAMLLYNDFSADTRVHKEARDLAQQTLEEVRSSMGLSYR